MNMDISPERPRTFDFPDPDALTKDGSGILLAAAYWMIQFRQRRTDVSKDNGRFELTITTDFSTERIGGRHGLEGTVFNAMILEFGQVLNTRFIVHRIPKLPPNFGSRWEFSALIRTFLRSNHKGSVLHN